MSVAWMEGLADAVSSGLKLVAGRWSDRIGRQKPFITIGYGISTVIRPLMAVVTAPWHVVALRSLDRVGKGIRTSPRDALLAASVPKEHRGVAYSFHRGMDHAGAVVGPLIAVALLTFWTRDLRLIFGLALIPGLVAVIFTFLVREAPKEDASVVLPAAAPKESLGTTLRALWRFLVPLSLFTLGNATDVFLLLKAQTERAPLRALPLLWVGLHITKMLTSVPGGVLADRYGATRIIIAGWLVYAAIYCGFAFTDSQVWIAVLFVVYGVHHGLTEGAERALVAELAARSRGAGFGWYYFIQGMLSLVASLLFGAVWETFGPRQAFLLGAALALVAMMALAVLRPMRANTA